MKVLQLIDSLSIGGAERMSVNIANAFVDNGINSYLVSTRASGPLKELLFQQVAHHCIYKKHGFDVVAFFRLLKIIKKIKPTAIHAHSSSVYWAVVVKFFFSDIKVIWHDHSGLSDTLKDKDRRIVKFISKWIDGVIVVNDSLAAWAKRNLQTPKGNILFLKNFPYLPPIQTFFVGPKPILLNLANFRPQKDQLNLLDAVKIIKDFGIDFELWLAGEHVDANWTKKIIDKINYLGLVNDVKILGAITNPVEILAGASIGILSSQSEGLPVSLLEYGLAKLPIIVTNTGQCKEVLKNQKFGIVVPPRNAKALADAISYVIKNLSQAQKMGVDFHNEVLREYGSSQFIVAYLNMLNKINKVGNIK